MQEQLRTLYDIPIVHDIRGVGLMACVECELNQGEGNLEMDYEIGNRIDKHCQALGLIVRPLINMCVMSPPLTITRQQIDEMVGILRKGIEMAMQDINDEISQPTVTHRHPAPVG
jgi:adenosylmethionine-8-amino-7-oxononanoate aminotransferase